MNATKEAVAAKLSGDAPLTTICGGENVYHAFDDHEFDFATGQVEVTLSRVSGSKQDRSSHREEIYQITCAARSADKADEAMDRVEALLDNQAMTATGRRVDEVSLVNDVGDDYNASEQVHVRVQQFLVISTLA